MAASSPGHIELERALDSIVVGTRHRTDLGDIDALVESISRVGLLQPITLTPDGVLVCGWRRYHALRRLGHRTTNVWIRSGLTDRLSQLLAEQDDSAMHKPLSLIEAESLYRELKAVMAEDAARRQEASRFGSTTRECGDDAEAGDIAGVSGAVESTAPRSAGEARVQAARMVTGRGSQTMLEQIGRLKDLACDDTRPEHIRAQAVEELARIEAGGKVHGSHLRMNAALSLDELDRLVTDPGTPEMVRAQAATSAAEVRAAGHEARTAELAQLAADAVARITAAKRAGKKKGKPEARPRLALVMLPPRAFLALWADLDGWTTRYEAAEIAQALTPSEWERVERVLAETIAFLTIIRDLRTEAAKAANDAAAEPRRGGVRAG